MTTEKRLFPKKDPNQNFTTTNELHQVQSHDRIIENPDSTISMTKTAYKSVKEYWNTFDGITLEKFKNYTHASKKQFQKPLHVFLTTCRPLKKKKSLRIMPDTKTTLAFILYLSAYFILKTN